MSQRAPNVQQPGDPRPSRRNARTFTVAGLLAVFIVAVVAVLASKLVPGRFTEYAERVRRRVR